MKAKKPMPEYWYNGKAIKDDKALIEALAKDGKLEVKKNITLYELHEDVCEAFECAFTWDLDMALDMIKATVDELDKGEDLNGIVSIDYVYGESLTINKRNYKWSGALRKLAKLGVITILPHQTIYCAENADYFYRDPEEPLKFLRDANEFQYFDEHLESLDEEEYEKACETYDI